MQADFTQVKEKLEAIKRREKNIDSMLNHPEDYNDREIRNSIAANFKSIINKCTRSLDILAKLGQTEFLNTDMALSQRTNYSETQLTPVQFDSTKTPNEHSFMKKSKHLEHCDICQLKQKIPGSAEKMNEGVESLHEDNKNLRNLVVKLEADVRLKDRIIEQLQHDKEFLEEVHREFESEVVKVSEQSKKMENPDFYEETMNHVTGMKESHVFDLEQTNLELNTSLGKLRKFCDMLKAENSSAFKEIKFEGERANRLEKEVSKLKELLVKEKLDYDEFKKEATEAVGLLVEGSIASSPEKKEVEMLTE